MDKATRTFQALRIEVNDEIGELERALERCPELLAPGGRMAVISFHSLEDRTVKNRFRELERSGDFRRLNRKVITASEQERSSNPRSRSAKLRGIERLEG
jgi:16S rRNA (cytosine1402-N4)-methyltransferase